MKILRWLVLLPTLCLGASLTVTLPEGCLPILSGSLVSCAGVTPPPVTLPPPTPPPNQCSGQVLSGSLDWSKPGNDRIFSNGFGAGNTWLISFTPGSGNGLGRVTVAEWGGGPIQRQAELSASPCGPVMGSTVNSTTPALWFWVGPNNPFPTYYAQVQSGFPYYVTVRNLQGGVNSCYVQPCDAFAELSKPK